LAQPRHFPCPIPDGPFKREIRQPGAHGSRPSYSGDRDQEHHGSRPVWANSLGDPISKISNTHTKRAGGVTQVVVCLSSKHEALNSKPSTAKKKKEGHQSLGTITL
jgi:hypothetical protein